jgi:starvation-inducible DNA-binding protein
MNRSEQKKSTSGNTSELQSILANTYVNTQGVHWNYTGTNFLGVHLLLEEHYQQMVKIIDTLAERLRALRCAAPLSIVDITQLADPTFVDQPHQSPVSGATMLNQLLTKHVTISKQLENAIDTFEDDAVTSDLLTDQKTFHDKAIWMLRSTVGNSATTSESESKPTQQSKILETGVYM